MFLLRSGVGMYTAANTVILGLLTGPVVVGYYAAAERINAPILGLLNPIQDALFPRLSRLAGESPSAAARLASIGAGVTLAVGIFLQAGIFVLAPYLVALLAGDKYVSSVGILRILAVSIPFSALTTAICTQFLLPL